MNKAFWIAILASFIVLGTVTYIITMEESKPTTVLRSALILSKDASENGTRLTVVVGNQEEGFRFYSLIVNATPSQIDDNSPSTVIFERRVPVMFMQDTKCLEILDWKELKTLEEMPELRGVNDE